MKKRGVAWDVILLFVAGLVGVIIILMIIRGKSAQAGSLLDWLRGML